MSPPLPPPIVLIVHKVIPHLMKCPVLQMKVLTILDSRVAINVEK